MPLLKILPDFSRAAESALARDGIPLEYDDFVKSYFLQLTKETKAGGGE